MKCSKTEDKTKLHTTRYHIIVITPEATAGTMKSSLHVWATLYRCHFTTTNCAAAAAATGCVVCYLLITLLTYCTVRPVRTPWANAITKSLEAVCRYQPNQTRETQARDGRSPRLSLSIVLPTRHGDEVARRAG